MQKQAMLRELERQAAAYRTHHPTTAEMDFTIFKAHCHGKQACMIAMEIPCAESTVYRAIRRVKNFLDLRKTLPIMETIRQYVAEHAPNNGDGDGQAILEMLYVAYTECNHFQPDTVRDGFGYLYDLLKELPLQSIDSVIEAVCALCSNHEHSGFIEGLKVGIRLHDELKG